MIYVSKILSWLLCGNCIVKGQCGNREAGLGPFATIEEPDFSGLDCVEGAGSGSLREKRRAWDQALGPPNNQSAL